MAKITIWGNDGKPLTHLTQWDNNRDVTVKGLKVFDQPPEFHFWDRDRFRAIVVPSEIVDGGVKAHVPNILMQSDDDVIFTVYDRTLGNEGRSVYIRNIPVLRAKKPEDYDYTDNIDYINFTQLIKEAEALLEMLRTAGDEALANSRAALEAATKALEQAASASQSASDAEALAKQFADQLAGFLVADDSQTTDKNLWTAKKIREEIDKGSPDGVTQKYVDQKDKETLDAAKQYADGRIALFKWGNNFADIKAAHDAQKLCMLTDPSDNIVAYLSQINSDSAQFTCLKTLNSDYTPVIYRYYVDKASNWSSKAATIAGYKVFKYGVKTIKFADIDNALQVYNKMVYCSHPNTNYAWLVGHNEYQYIFQGFVVTQDGIVAHYYYAKKRDDGYVDWSKSQYRFSSSGGGGEKQVFTATITNEVGRLVCDMTASEIIDASRKGVVKAEYTDEDSGETREYYYFKQMPDGRAVFTKDGYIEAGVPKQTLFYVDFAGNVEVETRSAAPDAAYAVCHDPAAPPSSTANTWYIPKSMPKPSGNVGMMVDVHWEHGRVSGLGYNASLIWGEPGGADNETIVSGASITDTLTGEHSIPTEGTVRYQLEETSSRMHWRYVSGDLIPTEFSTATDAATADKLVPGLALGYLPGMEIYVQMDNGNSADLMQLVPDEGATLPVYGNGTGAHTGEIPAGYILHLKNAGDHWQIINALGREGGVPDIIWIDENSTFETIENAVKINRLPVAKYGRNYATLHTLSTTEAKFFFDLGSNLRTWTFKKGTTGVTRQDYPRTPKASSSVLGGALADPADASDTGYVHIDEDGHLRYQGDVNKTAVLFTPQELTEEEKKQARQNIGADSGTGGPLQPLTFTGAVKETYDGTVPVTVEIPSGGGGGGTNRIAHYAVTGKKMHQVLGLDASTGLIEIADASDFPTEYGSVYSGFFQANPSPGVYPEPLKPEFLITAGNGILAAKRVDLTHIKINTASGELKIPGTARPEFNAVYYGRTPSKVDHTVFPAGHALRIEFHLPSVQNLNAGVGIFNAEGKEYKKGNYKNSITTYNRDTADFQWAIEGGAGFSKMPGSIIATVTPIGGWLLIQTQVVVGYSRQNQLYTTKIKESLVVYPDDGISKVFVETGNYESLPTGSTLDIYDLGAVK